MGQLKVTNESAHEVAIVGIGVQTPGVRGSNQFWDFLCNGESAISEVPKTRWAVDEWFHHEPLTPGKMSTRWGGFLSHPEFFDASFWNLREAEVNSMDPQQRLLLETTWDALEDAGIAPSSLAGTDTGVFVGISNSDFQRRILNSDPTSLNGYSATGSALSIAANRISYLFNLCGPSLAVDTACSSSLVATHLAASSISHRECSVAIVGGVNLITHPELSIVFTKAGMMAPDGQCRSFDNDASGYVRGEGVGVVVLKHIEQAILDGDFIYATIVGSAVNQDGRSNGLTAPNSASQRQVIARACESAGIVPADLGFIETHGTGTPLGDPIEYGAIAGVIGQPAGPTCWLGALKTNIGHLEAAAGIVSLIKTALVAKHKEIPGNLNFQSLNKAIRHPHPRLDIPRPGVQTPLDTQHCGVSGFGFGGTNVHVVLTCPPSTQTRSMNRPSEMFTLSAHSDLALKEKARGIVGYLDEQGELAKPYDLARLLGLGRDSMRYRLAICAPHCDKFKAELLTKIEQATDASTKPQRIAFVFNGQGTEYVRMAQGLCRYLPAFSDLMRKNDQILAKIWGDSILDAIWLDRNNPVDSTLVAQLAIATIQISFVDLLSDYGVIPDVVVGHSVGEIAACYAAGIYDKQKALYIAFKRASLMEDHVPRGGMAALVADEASVQSLIQKAGSQVDIAASNAIDQTIVSGMDDEIQKLEEAAQGNFSWRNLATKYPFHSRWCEEAAGQVFKELASVKPSLHQIEIYSTVDGKSVDGSRFDAGYWRANIRQTVRFSQAIKALGDSGDTFFVEIGSDAVLGNVIRRTVEGATVTTVLRRGVSDDLVWNEFLCRCFESGIDVNFRSHYPEIPEVPRLPLYPWDHRAFQHAQSHTDSIRRQVTVASGTPEGLEHPIVGVTHKIGLLPAFVWRGQLDCRKHPELSDHSVLGTPVLPASGYLQTFATCAELVFGPSVTLRDIDFGELLMLAEDGEADVLVSFTKDSDSANEFSVYSLSGDNWRHRARCLASQSTSPRATLPPIDEKLVNCLNSIAPGDFYLRLGSMGLNYGTAFQGLDRIVFSDTESVAWVHSPSIRNPHLATWIVLDAAIQSIAPLVPGFSNSQVAWLPKSVDVLELLGSSTLPERLICHATSINADETVGSASFDLVLFDEEENQLALIKGLCLRRVRTTPKLREVRSMEPSLKYYRSYWPRVELAKDHEQKNKTIAVIGLGFEVELELLELLERRGVETIYRVLPYDHPPDNISGVVSEIATNLFAPSEPVIDEVVCLWPIDGGTVEDSRSGMQKLANVALLAHEIALRAIAQTPRLTLVTQNAWSISGEEDIEPWSGAHIGLGYAVAFELPDLKCLRVDIGLEDRAGNLSMLTRLLFSDSLRGDQFAIRGAQVHQRQLGTFNSPAETEHAIRVQDLVLENCDATVLITGGTGALGLAAAERFVSSGAKRIALLARSEPTKEIASRIQRLNSATVTVRFYSTDLSVKLALEPLINKIENDLGKIAGVVHAAGVNAPGPLSKLDLSLLEEGFGAKAIGLQNLISLLDRDSVEFCVLFSSAAATLGAMGQGVYLAANAFLETAALVLNQSGIATTVLGWGPWGEGGMVQAAENNALAGITMIQPEAGCDALMQMVVPGEDALLVLPFEITSILQYYPTSLGTGLFSKLITDASLPLTSSAEPAFAKRPTLDVEFKPAETELEILVVGIFRRALEVSPIGVEDDFFVLGGDSVFATQVLAQINEELGVVVDSGRAFESFTASNIALLAEEEFERIVETMSDAEVENTLAEEGEH